MSNNSTNIQLELGKKEVDVHLANGDDLTKEQLIELSGIKVICYDKDVTKQLLTMDVSSYTNNQINRTVKIPWAIMIKGVSYRKGQLIVKITVDNPKKPKPIVLKNYKIEEDQENPLVLHITKGMKLPKGKHSLPFIQWIFTETKLSILDFNVYLVNKEGKVDRLKDFSDYYSYDMVRDNKFLARYNGDPILFDGKNTTSVVFMLSLNKLYDAYELEDFFEPTEFDIDDVILKDVEVEENLPQTHPTSVSLPVEIMEQPTTKSKSFWNDDVKSTLLAIMLVIGLCISGFVYFNTSKANALNSIKNEVTLIEQNQSKAKDLLNKKELSNVEITHIGELLNKNQSIIEELKNDDFFINNKKADLAEENNKLIIDLETRFENMKI